MGAVCVFAFSPDAEMSLSTAFGLRGQAPPSPMFHSSPYGSTNLPQSKVFRRHTS